MEEARAGPVGVDLQGIPSKDKSPPGCFNAWEEFLAGMEVFVETEEQQLLGPNYRFLRKYEASRDNILRNRPKVGNKGSLIVDQDGRGHHHGGKVTEDEKKAVMRPLEEYNLTRQSYRICHLRALRREGFGSPLDN